MGSHPKKVTIAPGRFPKKADLVKMRSEEKERQKADDCRYRGEEKKRGKHDSMIETTTPTGFRKEEPVHKRCPEKGRRC